MICDNLSSFAEIVILVHAFYLHSMSNRFSALGSPECFRFKHNKEFSRLCNTCTARSLQLLNILQYSCFSYM